MDSHLRLAKRTALLLRKHGAKRAGIFGSYARGDATPQSDMDILVEFQSQKSLLELVSIERQLSEEAGVKVDLLTEKSISPHILRYVKKDLKVIYG